MCAEDWKQLVLYPTPAGLHAAHVMGVQHWRGPVGTILLAVFLHKRKRETPIIEGASPLPLASAWFRSLVPPRLVEVMLTSF
jgi:hypothetical protein